MESIEIDIKNVDETGGEGLKEKGAARCWKKKEAGPR